MRCLWEFPDCRRLPVPGRHQIMPTQKCGYVYIANIIGDETLCISCPAECSRALPLIISVCTWLPAA